MKTLIYILFTSFLLAMDCTAQDYHFSQFDANPFYINPALTGERLGDNKGVQINADYRDQTGQLNRQPGAYSSVTAGADEPVNSKFSLGQVIFNDRGAKNGFNTFGFMVSAAHKIIDQASDKGGSHNLSVGIQLGFFNKTLFPDNFTYDSQYSGNSADGFDKSLPTGETFSRQSLYNFNANFGIYYRAISNNKKFTGFCGFAIYNITQPNQSFYGTGAYSVLPIRFNLHGGFVYAASKQMKMMLQALYMNQAKASELDVNVLLFSKIEGSSFEPIYGIGMRNQDAIIFHVGLKCKAITVRASYDVVINYAKTYGNRGLELSAVYTFKGKKSTEIKKESDLPPAEANTKP